MLPIGLSSEQAVATLRADGPNALPEPERRRALRIVAEVVREPMLALLIASSAIYLVLGELSDALILVGFALFSVVVTVVQEMRTERVLQSLRELTSPQALVIRDGARQRIAAHDVVRHDILVLREGDRVTADALVRESNELQVDESLLTGESVPVSKRPSLEADASIGPPGGDDLPCVFAGTMVVRGTGLAEVMATGPRTELGKIGLSLGSVQAAAPKLQTETRRLTLVFGILAVGVSGLAIILYGLLRDSWLNAILAGIALGMSVLPEEFPVVLAVFMAMGAWRISKARVLTRRSTAIEALGSATVLCTDKTGTLTANRMSVAELRSSAGGTWTASEPGDLSENLKRLVRIAALASAPDPIDPMELAFHDLAQRTGDARPSAWAIARQYGLRPDLLAVTQAWCAPGSDHATIAAKGAPEAIAMLCQIAGAELEQLHFAIKDMADRGLRVLAVAEAEHAGGPWPDSPKGFRFRFLGLVGLIDPIRPGVPEAVAELRGAGIRVVMVTGDHPLTAGSIARAAGLDAGGVLTGAELAAMTDAELRAAVQTCNVFARILPQQKLLIVEALKHNGDVVAMTGDGVNDAPSLKAADIGVAMGLRGTDVAREASAIVLLDDNFSSIAAAVRLGRRIYDNLRKAMGFVLAVHIPIAGLALLPLLTGMPILFWPVHIAFLEMIIDPVCSLVFEAEPEELRIMHRRPRRAQEQLLPMRIMIARGIQGLVVFVAAAAVFVFTSRSGASEETVRATTFMTLVGAIIALIFASRTFSASPTSLLVRPSPVLVAVLALVTVVLTVALTIPVISNVFGFASPPAGNFALAAGAILGALVLMELAKRLVP